MATGDPVNGTSELYKRYSPNDVSFFVNNTPIPQDYFAWTVTDPADTFGGGTVYTLTKTPQAGDAIFDANGNVIGNYDNNFYYNEIGYKLNQSLSSYSSVNNSITVNGTTSSVRVKIIYQHYQLISESNVPTIVVYPGTTNCETTSTEIENGIYFYLPIDRASTIQIGNNSTRNYYIMKDGVLVYNRTGFGKYSFTPTQPCVLGVCEENPTT